MANREDISEDYNQIHGILWASDSESDVDQPDFDPDSDRDVHMPSEFQEDYVEEEQELREVLLELDDDEITVFAADQTSLRVRSARLAPSTPGVSLLPGASYDLPSTPMSLPPDEPAMHIASTPSSDIAPVHGFEVLQPSGPPTPLHTGRRQRRYSRPARARRPGRQIGLSATNRLAEFVESDPDDPDMIDAHSEAADDEPVHGSVSQPDDPSGSGTEPIGDEPLPVRSSIG